MPDSNLDPSKLKVVDLLREQYKSIDNAITQLIAIKVVQEKIDAYLNMSLPHEWIEKAIRLLKDVKGSIAIKINEHDKLNKPATEVFKDETRS